MSSKKKESLSNEVLFRLQAEVLQNKRAQLTQNIDVSVLLNMACMHYGDRDRLKAVLNSQGSFEAAKKLLDVLVAKSGWWDEFLEVVRGYCEQGYLADMLETELQRLRRAHGARGTPPQPRTPHSPEGAREEKEGNEVRSASGKSHASHRLLNHMRSKEQKQPHRSGKTPPPTSRERPQPSEGPPRSPVQELKRSDTHLTNDTYVRQIIKDALNELSNRHEWETLCQLLLPVAVKHQQTSTLEDRLHRECKIHLPSTLKTLTHFRFSLGSTLCRLAAEFPEGAEAREPVYHCLFRFAAEESRALEALGWARAHIRPLPAAVPTSVATQTEPEDTNVRDESEKKLVVKVMRLLNIPHARVTWTKELQTQSIPQGASFRELVTNAIGPAGAAAVTVAEHSTSEDSDAMTESSDSHDKSASSSSSDADLVDGGKPGRGDGGRDGREEGKARQEHDKRQHHRTMLAADAQPAARDAVRERPAQEDHNCKSCGVRPVALVLLPCGHFCLCFRCISAVSRCPVCKSAIETSVRAYRS